MAAFLFGVGSLSMTRSWWNWLVGCAAIGLAALLAASMSDELKPLKVFALGGLVVATVHAWVFLGPLAVVAAAVAFLPLKRDRWPRTRGAWARMVAVLVATVAAVLAVVPTLTAVGRTTSGGKLGLLTYDVDILSGRFTRLAPMLLTGGMALAVALAAWVRNRSRESAVKGAGLAAVPGVAFLLMACVGAYQLCTDRKTVVLLRQAGVGHKYHLCAGACRRRGAR